MERPKSQPQRLKDFLDDVRSEMRKVVAPSREEVRTTTGVVIATVFLFAAYFEIVDFFIGQGVTRLIQHFTRIRQTSRRASKSGDENRKTKKAPNMAVEQQTPEAQNPEGEQPTEQLAPPVNENFKWYIIHAYSGFERKVRDRWRAGSGIRAGEPDWPDHDSD